VDILYDVLYEVISEEGVWVLILIASAFAVASFILLTLRIQPSPRQGAIGQAGNRPRREKKEGGTSPKVEGTATEPKGDVPESPEMTPPENFTHPEVVLPGSAPYKNIPQPVDEQASAEANETAPAAQPAPKPAFDPFDLDSLPAEETTSTETTPTGAKPRTVGGLGQVNMAGAGLAGTGGNVSSMGMGEMPQGEELIVPQKSKGSQESEDDETSEDAEKPESGDIFDVFEEAEEEQTELAEFARGLDDVAVSGLLTETEDLSQELKGILAKQGRGN